MCVADGAQGPWLGSTMDATASFEVNALAGWVLELGGDEFTILSNTATAIVTDEDDGDLTDSATVVSGTSDAVQTFFAHGSGAGNRLVFTAGTFTVTREDGLDWEDFGYAVGQWVLFSGAAAGGNNGWAEITAIAVDDMEVGLAGMVDATSSTSIVEGGVTARVLLDASGPFTADQVGHYVMPNTADTGGPGGTPRAFPLSVFNDIVRVTTTGGNMIAGAAPGNTYRVAPRYTLRPPWGGRGDPRPSIYTPLAASVFNDRGVMLYVDNDISARLTREFDARVPELLPATTTLQLRADGGGDGSVDVELLAVPS